jgi:hypothetical protein
MAFVAGRNMALAGDLVGGDSAEHARDSLVAEWAASETRSGYERWLIQRLDAISPATTAS